MAQQQQENQGPESIPKGDAHSSKARRPWGLRTEAAVGQEQQSDGPLMSSPNVLRGPKGAKAGGQRGAGTAPRESGVAHHGGSQSPMGKPPLPTARKLTAKGAGEELMAADTNA